MSEHQESPAAGGAAGDAVADPVSTVLADRSRSLRVWGGPGTGKTTLIARILASRIAAGDVTASQCLVLAPTRIAADRLRTQVTTALQTSSHGALVRTPHSLAYGLLRQAAARAGAPAPRLITGPEQDVILRELLAGHADLPERAPRWPRDLDLALPTRTFRSELRELLMRAIEHGLDAPALRELGERHGRAEWIAAAAVLAEYDEVTALASPEAMDPAWIVGVAADTVLTDPWLRAHARRSWRLLVVDDAQELSPPQVRLLQALHVPDGPDLVLLADPDQATQTFRGADPTLVGRSLGGTDIILPVGHRVPAGIAPAVRAVTDQIGVAGPRAVRGSRPGRAGGSIGVHLFRTAAQEAGWIADRLRRQHLQEGVPWSQMAVIVRGGVRRGGLERALRAAGVPVAPGGADVALADDPVVRPLLRLLQWSLDPGGFSGASVPERAAALLEVLQSPLGGADPVGVRRLRRALRRRELDASGARTSDELLADLLDDPLLLVPIGPEGAPARRVVRAVQAGRDCAARPGPVGVGRADEVLWAIWQACQIAEPWRRAALAGGVAGERADRALDAVVALFEAAARFTERLPGSRPESFLTHLLGQEVAADTIAARAPRGEAVELVTPALAAGRQWHTVFVAGVQEGAWPDLRVRGRLLATTELVDVVRGRPSDPRSARFAVKHDELRLFHVALTRASSQVLVSAVRSADEQPSILVSLLGGPAAQLDLTEPVHPLSLVGLVGGLRQAAGGGDPAGRAAALLALRDLATAGVRGAAPDGWWTRLGPSDDRPRRCGDDPVTISPSRLERFDKCPLQWLLSSSGGQRPMVGAPQIGTLVHEIVDECGDTSAEVYVARLRERWPQLGFGDTWFSRRELTRAEAMVGHVADYVAMAQAQGWTRLGSELRVDVQHGRAHLVGRVDRVEADREGALRVVDLKTGTRKPSPAEVARHPQLGAYQVAVDAGAFGPQHRSAGAALLQVGKARTSRTSLQVQPPLAQDPDPSWADTMLADAASQMGAAHFLARPTSELCGTCQVHSACPASARGRTLR